MTTNRQHIQQGQRAICRGRKIRVSALREGQEVQGVGVMEADAESLGDGKYRLHIAGYEYVKPGDLSVTVTR